MTDIKRSIELDAWLRAQDITVEPDEFAPCVWRQKTIPLDECVPEHYVGSTPLGIDDEFACAFYGPGGADNLLKALRGYEKTTSGIFSLMSWTEGEDIEAHWTDCMLPNVRGKGKTDGIALAELLWKIKEAS